MKIQRRNIKYWVDLKAASLLDIATEYVDQKQLKPRWTWKMLPAKVITREAGPGVLSLKMYAVGKQTRVLDYTCQHPNFLLLAMSCGLEVVYMWCGLMCQSFPQWQGLTCFFRLCSVDHWLPNLAGSPGIFTCIQLSMQVR